MYVVQRGCTSVGSVPKYVLPYLAQSKHHLRNDHIFLIHYDKRCLMSALIGPDCGSFPSWKQEQRSETSAETGLG